MSLPGTVLRVVWLLGFMLVLAGCAQLPPRPELPQATAVPLPPGAQTKLDRAFDAAEADHPDASAFHLVSEGRAAFALRWHSAGVAERSLDVQTYIWHADTTGLALAAAVIAAADRGVQVRLLVDDLDARARNLGFAALHAHPQIEVRLFNPFASRDGFFGFIGEAMGNFNRINRRMHNKSWIADNRVALVGGRNLGDEYFGASEDVNFEDLDFVMAGPVVRDVSDSFDRFWNSALVYPIDVLDSESVNDQNLQRLRNVLSDALAEARQGLYAESLRESDLIERLPAAGGLLMWSSEYEFVSDLPEKATGTLGDEASNVGAMLFPAMRGADEALYVISPYFVPGERGTGALVDLAQAGTAVRILTNSLAANDVAAVHGGYAHYRKALLAGGVELWEIKPTGGVPVKGSMSGSSGAALHTKAMIIDDEQLFVGSYNLDPRSTSLNSEQGVLVRSTPLAEALRRRFEQQTGGDHAWAVTLKADKLEWTDGQASFDREPQGSAWRRFQAWFARTFGFESQL